MNNRILFILALFTWIIISRDIIGTHSGPECFFVLENEKSEKRWSTMPFESAGYLYKVGDEVKIKDFNTSFLLRGYAEIVGKDE